MNIEKLREEIEYDEGNVKSIYLDHLHLPTFGIGHLVRESDPEYGWEVGTPVSDDRCVEPSTKISKQSCQTATSYTQTLMICQKFQRIIANMMFNLGYPRLSKFKGMKRGVDARDWQSVKQMRWLTVDGIVR